MNHRYPLADYYALLGVSPTASADEIRAAYRRLALRHHPDVNPPDEDDRAAATFMSQLNEAYDTLSEPSQRAAYDAAYGQQCRAQTAQVGGNDPTTVGQPLGFPLPAWLADLLATGQHLKEHLKVGLAPALSLLSLVSPVLILATLFLLSFGIYQTLCSDPLVIELFGSGDVILSALMSMTLVFFSAWLIVRFKR